MAKSEFQNSTPRLHFQSRGIFVIFKNFSDVFANRSHLPIFRVLKAPARSECGNEVPLSQKSCFTVKKMCTIYLIIIPKAWDGFHFIELCILIHDFTVQGLCGVTKPSPVNLISSSKSLIDILHIVQYLNFTI